jgi:CDP-diacylglycerol--glycerol-3-phosphate 3-phosphatidyltransferase
MACSLVAFSTASPSATQQPFHPAIDALTAKLDVLAPRFELEAGDVEVLITPEQFYATLRHKILAAKHRVFLSSLYIGKEESELVPPTKNP